MRVVNLKSPITRDGDADGVDHHHLHQLRFHYSHHYCFWYCDERVQKKKKKKKREKRKPPPPHAHGGIGMQAVPPMSMSKHMT